MSVAASRGPVFDRAEVFLLRNTPVGDEDAQVHDGLRRRNLYSDNGEFSTVYGKQRVRRRSGDQRKLADAA